MLLLGLLYWCIFLFARLLLIYTENFKLGFKYCIFFLQNSLLCWCNSLNFMRFIIWWAMPGNDLRRRRRRQRWWMRWRFMERFNRISWPTLLLLLWSNKWNIIMLSCSLSHKWYKLLLYWVVFRNFIVNDWNNWLLDVLLPIKTCCASWFPTIINMLIKVNDLNFWGLLNLLFSTVHVLWMDMFIAYIVISTFTKANIICLPSKGFTYDIAF